MSITLWLLMACEAILAQPKPGHNLIFDSLATRWDEAIPLGNGWLGASVSYTHLDVYKRQSESFIKNITALEEELYQTKNRSSQDPLNFPIKLNNRIAALRRSLETGEGKPTAGAGKVLDELSKELNILQSKLDQVMNVELPSINKILDDKGIKPVSYTHL